MTNCLNTDEPYISGVEMRKSAKRFSRRRGRLVVGAGVVVATIAGISFTFSGRERPALQVVQSQAPLTTVLGLTTLTSVDSARVSLSYLPPSVVFDSTNSNPRKGGLIYDLYSIPGAANLDTMPSNSSQNRLPPDGTQHPSTKLIVSKQLGLNVLPPSPAGERFDLIETKAIGDISYRLTTPRNGYGRLMVEWVIGNTYYYVGNDQLFTSDGTSGLGIDELLRIALDAR